MAQTAIVVEVVYALPHEQKLISLTVPPGTTVKEAIELCGLAASRPGIDAENVGIFGKRVRLNTILRNRDRIEIYRPLAADPKEARRGRVARD